MSAWVSSAEGDRQVAVIDFHRREVAAVAVMDAVRSLLVVEAEEDREVGLGFDLRAVALEVDLVMLDRAPQPLDEDVVEAAALAVHGQLHAGREQRLGKLGGGKLAALVGVEDLRRAIPGHRALHRPHAEAGIERVRQFPREDRPAIPVEHRAEVDEAAVDRHVGDVHRPDLVGPIDRQPAQQIREDRMRRVLPGEVGLSVYRLQAHQTHEPLHPLAVHGVALPAQPAGHLARAEERIRQIGLVDHPHQAQVRVGLGLRLVIVAGPGQAEQFALPGDRQLGMLRFDHAAALLNARAGQLFF